MIPRGASGPLSDAFASFPIGNRRRLIRQQMFGSGVRPRRPFRKRDLIIDKARCRHSAASQ
jgi:hypothetical protein